MNLLVRLHCCFLCLAGTLCASAAFSQTEPGDTSRVMTASAADTARSPIALIPNVGSIERFPTRLITDSTINFYDYRYAGDLVATVPGVFLLDLGSPGQLHGITVDGLDARNVAFMSDGILLNEPYTGTFDPYLYPTENIERLEIITGPRSFLYGLNSTGMAVNFVSRSRKAVHPYTRIRYQEAPYGQGFIDGMFSQDIIRGLNLEAGASHATYDGRFKNSNEDAWNARFKVRYNISTRLNVYASGMYNQTLLGLNGGVNLDATPAADRYDRLQAVMVNTDAYEKVTRYDARAGAAATLFGDTTAVTTVTFYHSTNFREYRDEENRPNPNGIYVKEDTRSQWYGAKLTQHLEAGADRFDLYAEASRRGTLASDLIGQSQDSYLSLSAKWEFRSPDSIWEPALYGRIERAGQESGAGIGGDLHFRPVGWIDVFAGGSYSHRFRSDLERLGGGSNLSLFDFYGPPLHNTLAECGLRVGHNRSASAGVTFDYRYINGTDVGFIVVEPEIVSTKDVSAQSLRFDGMLRWGSFSISGSVQRERLRVEKVRIEPGYPEGEMRFLPQWSGTCELYYWDKLFAGHLDLKTGIRVKGFSHFRPSNYDARYQYYIESSDPEIPGAADVDFVLIAHIGDAYVHLVMENLADKKYVVTSFYPMNERSLRFGLSWDFQD